jgi:FkbM family methyltransferase
MQQDLYWIRNRDTVTALRLLRALPQPRVVFDVGANCGLFTVPFGRHLRQAGGIVFALEPVRPNFELLLESIRLNGLEETVRPFDIALGDREGTVSLIFDDDARSQGGNAAVLAPGEKIETAPAVNGLSVRPSFSARVTRLDAFAAERRIESCALMKIDVEGYELRLLSGAEQFLRQFQPVVLCELNPCKMRDFHWTAADLVDLIKPLGYSAFREAQGAYTELIATPSHTEDVLLLPSHPDVARFNR